MHSFNGVCPPANTNPADVRRVVIDDVINSLNANGVERSLCVMGGEPLCDENLEVTDLIISEVLKVYPDKEVYIWTGYTYEELLERNSELLNKMLVGTPIDEVPSKLEFDIKPIIGNYIQNYEVVYNAFYNALSNFTIKL